MTEQTIGPDRLVGVEIGGKYKIVRLLGEGGMGCVYQGEQKLGATVRKVAIKTLHEHLSHDTQILARFEREVGTVAGLQHPNTIQVFDFGKMDDGTLYIVMEFVEGKSVAGVLESEGPMDPARVQNILKQVCGSLEEAHGLGIVHRDLKPDNIVLCDKAGQHDWVEVLDFGIAKRSSEVDEREQKLTQQGMVLGTPPYMSPEQFTGKPVDRRSDIYSLAVMAYEMLTGGLPFNGNTAWEWATAHMTAQPRPLDTYPVSYRIPPAMKNAILRALAKEPDNRFATVTDFFNAFSSGAADARVPTQPGAPLMDPMSMSPGVPPTGAQHYPTGSQPYTYTPQPFPQMMTPPPVTAPQKKSSAGIVVAILGVLVLLAGIAAALAIFVFAHKPTTVASTDTTRVAATAPETVTATAAPTATGPLEPLAVTSASAKQTFVAPAPTHVATAAPTHTVAAPPPTHTTEPTYNPAPTYAPTQPAYTAPPTYNAPPNPNEPYVCQQARAARTQRLPAFYIRDLKRKCMQQNGGIAPF
ncbi:MAG TPA: protein kinase [Polyangiaceae bacterium]|jgi:serine/threonine-protein kinase